MLVVPDGCQLIARQNTSVKTSIEVCGSLRVKHNIEANVCCGAVFLTIYTLHLTLVLSCLLHLLGIRLWPLQPKAFLHSKFENKMV